MKEGMMEKAIGKEPKVFHLGWERTKAKPGKLKHRGVLTLAVREEAPQVMVLGFTFCSPTDQFDRSRGHRDAIRIMGDRPIRFRYIGDQTKTINEVVRCLCMQEFEELGHFCGEHLHYALFSTKFVSKMTRGGKMVEVLEECCRVPAWARQWYLDSNIGSPLHHVHISDLVKAGIGVSLEAIPKKSPVGRILTDIFTHKRLGGEVAMNFNELPGIAELLQKIRTAERARLT
jgi:hypothetical protein